VSDGKTGSSVERMAAWLEVVYCCAQSWMEKATAVARNAQIAIPIRNLDSQEKRAGSQPVEEVNPVASHARAAQAATWRRLSPATERRRV
jgi:hypothetical protein